MFKGYKGPLSYSRAYAIICKTGTHPHYLRSQRASCLVSFYNYTVSELMEWFTWMEITTAQLYAQHGDTKLFNKMDSVTYDA